MSGIVFMNKILSPIAQVEMDGSGLVLHLVTGAKVEIWDDASYCCERRHATCDDDLSSVIGGVLMDVVWKGTGDLDADGDAHDLAFVDVITSKGTLTLCNHNEHNGYYGGFDLNLSLTSKDGDNTTFEYVDHSGWRLKDE